MLKNILVTEKRFSSLQPLRKRGEVLKKADENKVAQITKVIAKLERKASENALINIEKKAEKKFK